MLPCDVFDVTLVITGVKPQGRPVQCTLRSVKVRPGSFRESEDEMACDTA